MFGTLTSQQEHPRIESTLFSQYLHGFSLYETKEGALVRLTTDSKSDVGVNEGIIHCLSATLFILVTC